MATTPTTNQNTSKQSADKNKAGWEEKTSKNDKSTDVSSAKKASSTKAPLNSSKGAGGSAKEEETDQDFVDRDEDDADSDTERH
jgi:hypothetical protein